MIREFPQFKLGPLRWILVFGAMQVGIGVPSARPVRGQDAAPRIDAEPLPEPSAEPSPFDPPPPQDDEPKPPRPEIDEDLRILLAPRDLMGGGPETPPTVTPERVEKVRLLYLERLDPKDIYERNRILSAVSFLIDKMADFDLEGVPYDRDAYVESILRKLPKDHPLDVLGGIERLARLEHPDVETYLESLLDYDFELVRNAARDALLAMNPQRASVAVVTVDDMSGSSPESDQTAGKSRWLSTWWLGAIVLGTIGLGVIIVVKARRH
jgi:hypothetical protein